MTLLFAAIGDTNYLKNSKALDANEHKIPTFVSPITCNFTLAATAWPFFVIQQPDLDLIFHPLNITSTGWTSIQAFDLWLRHVPVFTVISVSPQVHDCWDCCKSDMLMSTCRGKASLDVLLKPVKYVLLTLTISWCRIILLLEMFLLVGLKNE